MQRARNNELAAAGTPSNNKPKYRPKNNNHQTKTKTKTKTIKKEGKKKTDNDCTKIKPKYFKAVWTKAYTAS